MRNVNYCKYKNKDKLTQLLSIAANNGIKIIDVGCVSTKPGFKDVNYEDSLIIQNKLLLDLYESQKNIIHFRGKNENKSFLMNYKKTEIQLNLR